MSFQNLYATNLTVETINGDPYSPPEFLSINKSINATVQSQPTSKLLEDVNILTEKILSMEKKILELEKKINEYNLGII